MPAELYRGFFWNEGSRFSYQVEMRKIRFISCGQESKILPVSAGKDFLMKILHSGSENHTMLLITSFMNFICSCGSTFGMILSLRPSRA